MNRESSWSNIGISVEEAKNVQDVLEKAGLNYEVVKRKLTYNLGGSKHTVPGKVVTVREDNPDKVYGIVGTEYNICQNFDAFKFLDNINNDIKFVKAGETTEASGARIWIIGELPETRVLDDVIKPHIIFENSHNGCRRIQANICMLRIICQNQFNYAFDNGANIIKIKHTNKMETQMKEAEITLKQTYDYISKYKDMADSLATKHVSDKILQQIIKQVVGYKSIEEISNLQTKHVDDFMKAYNEEDNQNFKGTAWGIVNAYTDYSTHKTGIKTTNIEKTRENLFLKNTFDSREINNIVNILKAA